VRGRSVKRERKTQGGREVVLERIKNSGSSTLNGLDMKKEGE